MKKLLTLTVLAGLGVGGWYTYRYFRPASNGPTFKTEEITRTSVVSTVSATGTIEPLVKVLVGSQVSGTITGWKKDFNEPVEEAEVLAELDQDRFSRAVDMRTAAVSMARANAEQARVRYEDASRERRRIEALFERKTASENEILVVRANEAQQFAALHAAEAQIAMAEAELKAARVDLDRTIIRSPIDGVVISRDIDAGQTVAATMQAPTLFTIAADLKRMRVHANVSESDIGKVRDGMDAEFVVDAYPGRKFRGKVAQVRFNPTITENVVTYVTLIDVQNDDLALRPGMTATIAFEVDRADDVLTVPSAALRFRPGPPPGTSSGTSFGGSRPSGSRNAGGPTVHRLVNGAPESLAVKVGLSDGTRTEVSGEGLEPGTPVIVEQIVDAAARPYNPQRAMQIR